MPHKCIFFSINQRPSFIQISFDFTECSFSVPGSHPKGLTIFNCHLSLGCSWPRHFSCLWGPWQLWGLLSRYFCQDLHGSECFLMFLLYLGFFDLQFLYFTCAFNHCFISVQTCSHKCNFCVMSFITDTWCFSYPWETQLSQSNLTFKSQKNILRLLRQN